MGNDHPGTASEAETVRAGSGRESQAAHVSAKVEAVIAAIEAAGGEVDEDGMAWVAAAVAAAAAPGEFSISAGVGGHELALLDFDPESAGRLRRLGEAIGTAPAPDVGVALAVCGSAAQGRVQPFPADVDFFERVHVVAATREEALRRLGEIVRATVERVEAEPGFALEEVYFGHLPDHLVAAQPHRIGSALAWRLADVVAGVVELRLPGGGAAGRVTWAEAAANPGFVKLDWFVTDRDLGGPMRVSKLIDPTWEGPDGRVVGLDGTIDGDFQQVYLAATAAVLAERLVGSAAGDLAAYVAAMEREVVVHGRRRPPDFGKVAKRLYNLCRLTGRFAEALFVRELLSTAPARLHQARAALEVAALDCGVDPGRALEHVAALLGELEAALLGDDGCGAALATCREAVGVANVEGVRAALGELDALLRERINDGFRARLLGFLPTAALLAELAERHPTG